jgi:hypothetical protein
MKRAAFILTIITCLLLTFSSIHPQEVTKPFSIHYNHAGLSMIVVKDGQLHHTWHSPRHFGEGEPMVMRQDLSSYDRYEAHIWLTQQEMKLFQDWIAEHKVFLFKPFYESASEGRSYGAAFKTTLTVTQGAKTHAISWTGDSKIPDQLQGAISKLTKLCEKVQQTRTEKE